MRNFFGFASSLNRDPSTTSILLATVFLLANSLIISTGYRIEDRRRHSIGGRIGGRRPQYTKYTPYTLYTLNKSCMYINSDGTLMCDHQFQIPYNPDDILPWKSYNDVICLLSCDDSISLSTIRSSSNKRIRKFDSSALKCMKCIEDLDLSNSLELTFGDNFQDLSKLKILTLSKNAIESLSSNTFRSLVWLEKLSLDHNRIQSIPKGLFDDLKRLQTLNLEDNQLDGLNYQILSPLTNLKHLNLKRNKLRSLADTFKKNLTLEVLDLSSNSNLTLESDTFEGLKFLNKLSINDCKITSFPINLFQNIQGLRNLYINNNHLGEVSFETFGNLKSLSQFHAISNNISVLRDKPFRYLRNLTEIDLTGNSLVYINEFDLEGLSSLNVLKLPFNSIEYVSQRSFKDMPLLETLDLKHNKINTSFSVENNTKLKSIDISYNQLTVFMFTGLENLPLLKEFKVTSNAIKNLSIPVLIPPTSPAIIPKFHLERNKIEKIMFMTTNKSLSSWNFSVYLEGNPLVCDCHMYDLYGYLIDNRVSPVKFEDSIICLSENKPIKRLKSDYFTCNIEDSCPYNCKCIYKAFDRSRSVDCSKKNYTNLPIEIPPDIHILYIAHNNLTSLSNLKEPCWENLTELHSDGNKITFEEFSMPRNLKYLGLKDNKIEALPEAIRKHAETSKNFKMTLSNNLWRCDDCVLQKFLSKYGNRVVDKDSIRCTFANGTQNFFNLIRKPDSDVCPDIHSDAFVIDFMLLILCIV